MSDDLDRMMAERVMGWKLGDTYWHGESVGGISAKYSIHEWHPSEDIAQAMMCLEKFGRKWFLKFTNGEYCCALAPWEGDYSRADTPALAICRAIEKALEEK